MLIFPTAPEAPSADMPARKPVKATPLPIPDVRGFVTSASACAIERNHVITAGYQELGALVQDMVDPAFRREGTSSVAPNWFAVGAYIANAVGKTMVVLSRARDLLASRADLAEVSAALGLGEVGARAAHLLRPLVASTELTSSLSRSLFALLLVVRRHVSTAEDVNAGVLPRFAFRSVDLLLHAEGRGLAERIDAVLLTAYNVFADGNKAIYVDVAGAGQDFFELRQISGPFASDEVMFQTLAPRWAPRDPAVFAKDAREIVAYCRAHLGSLEGLCGLTSHFRHLCDRRGSAFLAAAFALYEEAGRTPELWRKNQFAGAANALLALREQRDIVQRAFEGRGPGEVERAEVFRLLTPYLTITIGPSCWRFSQWAESAPARRPRERFGLGRLEPAAARYNWSVFEERWPPILGFFEHVYRKPELVWIHRFNPDPRV